MIEEAHFAALCTALSQNDVAAILTGGPRHGRLLVFWQSVAWPLRVAISISLDVSHPSKSQVVRKSGGRLLFVETAAQNGFWNFHGSEKLHRFVGGAIFLV